MASVLLLFELKGAGANFLHTMYQSLIDLFLHHIEVLILNTINDAYFDIVAISSWS